MADLLEVATHEFSEKGLASHFRAREVAAIEMVELEVGGPSLWIRPLRTLVGDE